MPKKCIECAKYPVLRGEEVCDHCYDALALLPTKRRDVSKLVHQDKVDPVLQVVELIGLLTLDQMREVIMMIEEEFFVKAKRPINKGRRIPTYRWIQAGEQIDGCHVGSLETKEERILAHYRGECKNRECQRGFMKISYHD